MASEARQRKPAGSQPTVPSPSSPTTAASSPRVPSASTRVQPFPVRVYLLLYNLASASAWAYLLYLNLAFILRPSAPSAAPNVLSKLFGAASAPVPLPASVHAGLKHLQGFYDYQSAGWWTKVVQSCAVLEVVNAAVGWVRSPVGTVAAQVASRLWTVWGVVEREPSTHSSPLFTTMLFAWSLTETIRYLFYALSIFGRPPHALLWLRYTTFLPLYPLGAASEAFISFFTLPPLFPPGVSALSPLGWILTNLPGAARDSLLRTKLGRQILWGVALSKTKAAQAVHRGWKPIDALRLAMFVVWWPALLYLYTYMLSQRRKVLGTGRILGTGKSKRA